MSPIVTTLARMVASNELGRHYVPVRDYPYRPNG